MSTPTPATPVPAQVEKRTIDHIPEDERHGRGRDLFTVWFGSNIMLLTIITGALATTVFGLPLWAGVLAVIIGNVVGGIVMALHAAQGPQMGVPQMLQTRAQFGSYGSLLVVVLVVFMYLGFFASNAVLGGQALAQVTGMPTGLATFLIGCVSVVATMVGYKLIHSLAAVLSVVAGGALIIAFIWMVWVNGLPEDTLHTDGFSVAGFMATISVAALWQIAYAPYVSDYTRYMPKDTGVRAAFWATYAGCVIGSTLPMLLGALVGAALPNDDTIAGMGTLTHGVTTGIFIVFAVGVAATNSMDLYCGSLSTITIGQNIFPRWQPRAISRAITAVVLFAVAIVPAIFSADDFLANYANFLALLLCVLIPWTAINLVDYYVLRHGDYDIPSLFERDGGVYGTFNWTAIACYFIGIVIQIPFLSTTLFTGFAAEAINGVDISWLVGLAVICPLYYVLMRPQFQESAEPAAEPA
ncbi:cytosine permease [Gordonia amarae]|uniref:Cytosine permease n=2 Tax=Gordonia amarae TaxID=36821 RepID=A0A857KN60_9ACTN|nr:cytosine permease [Gordonia amarae]MCS3879312.1 NCS1 family nucleobase:cation symporter-1 [Gordonia amarae]QHN17800.1 cytosine permease [Gordonia amarae]QHN22331.1 cytosine permease [Gordonia amarae]QHN31207.1 cytosine permease [Gordonia amarae]QHN39952.1 cytosine permease [Gordonia amarae]